MADESHIIYLTKGREQYVLLLQGDQYVEAMRQLGRWAVCESLSFNWLDACRMALKLRELDKVTG